MGWEAGGGSQILKYCTCNSRFCFFGVGFANTDPPLKHPSLPSLPDLIPLPGPPLGKYGNCHCQELFLPKNRSLCFLFSSN